MSNFVSLHTGLSAIRAAQVGLDTASHNVANAGNAAYTRQRTDLRARSPYESPVGAVGTGVDVTAISRLRDAFLDARVRATTSDSSRLDTRTSLLERAEAVLGEPDGGISGLLAGVWDAFHSLALDPAGGAARREVLAAIDALASRFRSVDAAWGELAADVADRGDAVVAEANALFAEVAELNRQVALAAGRGEPNDLLDRRDAAVDRLAALTGTRATRETDGSVTVRLGAVTLVDFSAAASLTLSGGVVTAAGTDLGGALGGELAALVSFAASDLPALRSELGAFAVVLADTLNAVHASGYDPSGAPGGPLLAYDPAAPAATLAAAVTDPARLAAAGTLGPDGVPPPHDATNAERLAALRTAPLPGGGTLDGGYRALVTGLAAGVADARRAAAAQGMLTLAAVTARQSVHGVSLDEEMVAVVSYQRALEAASRVMTAVDEALDVLVNRTGLVGR